jgi:Mobilization protein NikA
MRGASMTPHDNAPPASPPGGEDGGAAPSPRSWRSGSQKRRRKRPLQIPLTDAEWDALMQKVEPTGLSAASYGRASVLGSPGPRAQRRPPADAVAIAKATAALNKVGSNLNQIAHVLNAGGAIGLAGQYSSTLAIVREAAAAIREAVGRKPRV